MVQKLISINLLLFVTILGQAGLRADCFLPVGTKDTGTRCAQANANPSEGSLDYKYCNTNSSGGRTPGNCGWNEYICLPQYCSL